MNEFSLSNSKITKKNQTLIIEFEKLGELDSRAGGGGEVQKAT